MKKNYLLMIAALPLLCACNGNRNASVESSDEVLSVNTTLVDAEEAELKPGTEVEIVHGQFAGIRGKLHKSNRKYWFIKTVGGISVMLRISRWYCKPI